jgi:uncharacterized protein YxjI
MLEARRFLVKERVKFLKSHHTYDLYDPDGDPKEPVGVAEETIGTLAQILRWFVSKQLMPTRIEVREKPDDSLVFTISRGWYIFRSRVEVHDSQGALVGYFKSKLISWSGGFTVYDPNDKPFADVKGNFIGFKYRMTTPDGAVELGNVSKKWGGVAKELFTSSDTYLVEVAEDLDEQPIAKMLVVAAALATDMIFKSESRTSGDSLLDAGG